MKLLGLEEGGSQGPMLGSGLTAARGLSTQPGILHIRIFHTLIAWLLMHQTGNGLTGSVIIMEMSSVPTLQPGCQEITLLS